MALKKQINYRSGVSGDYLRISDVSIKNGSNVCLIRVQVWKDHGTRSLEGAIPLEEANFEVELSNSTLSIQECYEKLKILPDFSGATDI